MIECKGLFKAMSSQCAWAHDIAWVKTGVLSAVEQPVKWAGRGHPGSRNLVWVKLGRTHEQGGNIPGEFVPVEQWHIPRPKGQTDWANEYRIIKLGFLKRKVTKHFHWSTGVPWDDKKKGLGARDEVALHLWPPQGSPPGAGAGEGAGGGRRPGRSSLHPAWAWLYQTGSGRDAAGQNP